MEREGVPDQAIINYHLREMEFMAQGAVIPAVSHSRRMGQAV
eukprot:gene8580-8762_t